MRGHRNRFGWALRLSLVASLALPACARRTDFTPGDLTRVQTEADVQPLRVYMSETVIARYPRSESQDRIAVRGAITESSRQDVKDVETTRNTMGLILSIDELNGQPLLWVTFDARCKTEECAYGFVQTEDERFRLVTVPELPGYQAPTLYRRRVSDKNELTKGKLASLAEANEVYVYKKSNGDIATIELQVKKRTEDRSRTVRQRQRGVGIE